MRTSQKPQTVLTRQATLGGRLAVVLSPDCTVVSALWESDNAMLYEAS